MNCLSVQFQSMSLIMNRLPASVVTRENVKELFTFTASVLGALNALSVCLSLLSLGLSLYHGLLISLARRGGPLLHLLRRGGLLSCSGGLLLRLLLRGGLLSRSGGLLLRLFLRGGLRLRLLRPGGLLLCLFRLLRPGGHSSVGSALGSCSIGSTLAL